MARKIVRDLNKAEDRGSFTIRIRDEDLTKATKKKKKNLLDLSQIDGQKVIIANSNKENAGVKDLLDPKVGSETYYFHVEGENQFNAQINDLIRMVATGLIILLFINLINVYERGIALKNTVVAQASAGYDQMINGGKKAKNADFNAAENSFIDARNTFEKALDTIFFLQSNQDYFFAKEKTVDSINGLLQAAKSLAAAGGDFSQGVKNLQNLPSLFLQYNRDSQKPDKSLTQKLKEDLNFLDKATAEIENASKNLALVSPEVLPAPLIEKLTYLKTTVQKILNTLNSTKQRLPAILDLLGDRYPHRYLILLQNDAEARPTGGFIGSYILADLNDGYLTKLDFHDIYESDGQLKENIPAPEDIASITKNWRMRDSNYSPDYSISAEKAAWFLQKEKGPSVDTVIAINQSFLAELLEITGPIQVPGLSLPLDRDNYSTVLSYIIESKLNGEQNPKQILNDFISAFQSRLFSSGNLTKVVQILIKGYQNKKLLFYSRYENIQALFGSLGMSNPVKKTGLNEDYLNVIVTSIGGNKSDAYISQEIQHDTFLDNQGILSDELTISRKHNFNQKDLDLLKKTVHDFGFNEANDGIIDILGRGMNKSIIKIYVPKGSVLIDAYLIDKSKVVTRYDDQLDKNYFMFELDVSAGQEKKASISYQLPFSLNVLPADNYKLFVQRQPTINISKFTKSLIFKPGLQSYKEYPSGFKKDQNGVLGFAGDLGKDLYLGAVVGS